MIILCEFIITYKPFILQLFDPLLIYIHWVVKLITSDIHCVSSPHLKAKDAKPCFPALKQQNCEHKTLQETLLFINWGTPDNITDNPATEINKTFHNVQINASYIPVILGWEDEEHKGFSWWHHQPVYQDNLSHTLSFSLITRCMSGRVCFHISCALCYTQLPVNHLTPKGSGKSSPRGGKNP